LAPGPSSAHSIIYPWLSLWESKTIAAGVLLYFRGRFGLFFCLTLSIFLIPVCLADPAPVIHYASLENLEHADVALIGQAEHNIDIAAYVLTDWPVMRALIRAAERGVKVRLYMDGRRIGEREPTPLFRELLATPEIDVRFKRAGAPLMHLKSYQVDGRWLRTGAANFSASGLKRQDNDLLIIDSQAAATAFERRFDAIFAGGDASGGQSP
jgi:hypothetical protein